MCAHHEPIVRAGEPEPGAAGGDPDVAAARDERTGTEGGAVHRGDDRLRRGGDSRRSLRGRIEPMVTRLVRRERLRHVGSGAERLAGAFQHEADGGVVLLELLHPGQELPDDLAVQGVAFVGAIQADPPHTILD